MALADETATRTREIEDIITDIQAATDEVVEEMEQIHHGVDDGADTVRTTLPTLERISARTARDTEGLAAAAEQQSASVSMVTRQVTQLAERAGELREAVETFDTSSEASSPADPRCGETCGQTRNSIDPSRSGAGLHSLGIVNRATTRTVTPPVRGAQNDPLGVYATDTVARPVSEAGDSRRGRYASLPDHPPRASHGEVACGSRIVAVVPLNSLSSSKSIVPPAVSII